MIVQNYKNLNNIEARNTIGIIYIAVPGGLEHTKSLNYNSPSITIHWIEYNTKLVIWCTACRDWTRFANILSAIAKKLKL